MRYKNLSIWALKKAAKMGFKKIKLLKQDLKRLQEETKTCEYQKGYLIQQGEKFWVEHFTFRRKESGAGAKSSNQMKRLSVTSVFCCRKEWGWKVEKFTISL